ncbi:hypothetical protein [Salinimicrobium flavum]|uniref:Uncharacterized protein n=1 Tax=Salinimicrobium flavum TaxID=1737065 RepID=A0ABW5IZZ1_9FLAO
MYEHNGNAVDWTKHYASIGQYVAEFEEIVHNIRFWSCAIFQTRGLKNWKLAEITFSQKQFTADPLINCYESLCNEILKNQENSKGLVKEISNFRNKFSKQVSVRNDLLHSRYLIGADVIELSDNPQPENNRFRVYKLSPDKRGARRKEVVQFVKDVENHISELRVLNEEFKEIAIKVDMAMTED